MKKRLKELYDMEEDRTELELDLFRDVPAAYAVFQVIPDEDGSGAMDARYVYVNQLYCTIAGCTPEDLLGHRFYEVYPQGNPLWMECCHRAVTEQKEIHGSLYEGAVSHWLDFSVKFLEDHPGWVAFVFMIADREREERDAMRRGMMTDDVILRISRILNGEEGYQASMDYTLEALGDVIHPDRLYILETDGKTVSNTFEWCAPGIEPEIQTLQNLDYQLYMGGWDKFLESSTCVLIEDIELLREEDPVDYENLKRQNIQRLIAAPFYQQGQIVGFLGADNYEKNDLINTREVLETISYFLSFKIRNHKLVQQLDHMSRYDALTGVHNRNALQETLYSLALQNRPLGVIYADVNGLKATNDHQGHRAGDALICRAAGALVRTFSREQVFREGGDEFIVLAQNLGKREFSRRVEQLRRELAEEPEPILAVGSLWLEDSARIRQAIRQADREMYQDKTAHYALHERRHGGLKERKG